MGLPLVPVLENLFMGNHEYRWLSNYSDSVVLYYRRYVDDTLCLFHSEHDAILFYNYLNSRHPNIKFTFETQINGKLFSLHVLVDNPTSPRTMSTYYKKNYIGLLIFSFTSFKCKIRWSTF